MWKWTKIRNVYDWVFGSRSSVRICLGGSEVIVIRLLHSQMIRMMWWMEIFKSKGKTRDETLTKTIVEKTTSKSHTWWSSISQVSNRQQRETKTKPEMWPIRIYCTIEMCSKNNNKNINLLPSTKTNRTTMDKRPSHTDRFKVKMKCNDWRLFAALLKLMVLSAFNIHFDRMCPLRAYTLRHEQNAN